MKIILPDKIDILHGEIILKKLEQEVSSNNYWKTMFLIHAIIQEMLWQIAIYGHAKRKDGKLLNRYYGIRYDLVRQDFDSFYMLVRLCFISNFISKRLQDNLLKFNTRRNKIAHLELYDKFDNLTDFDDNELISLLKSGIKLMKNVSDAQEKILRKVF